MNQLKSFSLIVLGLILLFSCKAVNTNAHRKQSILVFSLTKGYHHVSIADGIIAFKKMGNENNFNVDTTTDVNAFTTENLKKYKALVFLSPTGSNVFSDAQKEALKQYVKSGGGVVAFTLQQIFVSNGNGTDT